jgi:hypothetical protein
MAGGLAENFQWLGTISVVSSLTRSKWQGASEILRRPPPLARWARGRSSGFPSARGFVSWWLSTSAAPLTHEPAQISRRGIEFAGAFIDGVRDGPHRVEHDEAKGPPGGNAKEPILPLRLIEREILTHGQAEESWLRRELAAREKLLSAHLDLWRSIFFGDVHARDRARDRQPGQAERSDASGERQEDLDRDERFTCARLAMPRAQCRNLESTLRPAMARRLAW